MRVAHNLAGRDASPVTFDDIIGMESVKSTLRDFVVLPSLRPEVRCDDK